MSRKGRNLWDKSERGQLVVVESVSRVEELAWEQATQENPMEPGADAIEWSDRVRARAEELIAERSKPAQWWEK